MWSNCRRTGASDWKLNFWTIHTAWQHRTNTNNTQLAMLLPARSTMVEILAQSVGSKSIDSFYVKIEGEHIVILILTQRVEASRGKMLVQAQELERLVQTRGRSRAEARWRQRLVVHWLTFSSPTCCMLLPCGWSASSAPMGQPLLPADYWSECVVIVVAASYGFPDEKEMLFSYCYEMQNDKNV